MAKTSNCLQLIDRMPQQDQDALVARLEELQAQGMKPEEAQLQAAIDVLAQVEQEGGAKLSTERENNASGESPASMEAQSRVRDEASRGRMRVLWDRSSGIRPVVGVDGADQRVRRGQVLLQRGVGAAPWTVLDKGDGVGKADVARAMSAAGQAAMRATERYTDTDNFKRWFADSVMTETRKPGGEPLVLYHGGFDFVAAPGGKAIPRVSSRGALGVGFYMTPDKYMAEEYQDSFELGGAPGRVNELYARVQKPLVIKRDDPGADAAVEALVLLGMPRDKAQKKANAAYDKYGYVGGEIKTLAQEQGYDGLAHYYKNQLHEVVVWTPVQVKSATDSNGDFSWNPDIRKSAERPRYSQLERAIEGVPARLDNQAGVQWAQWLKANAAKMGVKQDEITWSGIEDFLKLKGKDKVSKDEIGEYLAQGGVRVEEVTLGGDDSQAALPPGYEVEEDGGRWFVSDEYGETVGEGASRSAAMSDAGLARGSDTKYSQYTLPGGTNYREVLLTLPEKPKESWLEFLARRGMNLKQYSELPLSERRIMTEVHMNQGSSPGNYKSNHWDTKNVVAHIRLNDRVDSDGRRVLFVDELQSDFGSDTRKQRANVAKAVDDSFEAIIERMKKAGVLEVVCD